MPNWNKIGLSACVCHQVGVYSTAMAQNPRASGAAALREAIEADGLNAHSLSTKLGGKPSDSTITNWMQGGGYREDLLYVVCTALNDGPHVLEEYGLLRRARTLKDARAVQVERGVPVGEIEVILGEIRVLIDRVENVLKGDDEALTDDPPMVKVTA